MSILPVYIYIYILCMGVCLCTCPCAHQVPSDVRKGCHIPWNWSLRSVNLYEQVLLSPETSLTHHHLLNNGL